MQITSLKCCCQLGRSQFTLSICKQRTRNSLWNTPRELSLKGKEWSKDNPSVNVLNYRTGAINKKSELIRPPPNSLRCPLCYEMDRIGLGCPDPTGEGTSITRHHVNP
eukprot:116477-Pelagomonas_calceolata.AAC.1